MVLVDHRLASSGCLPVPSELAQWCNAIREGSCRPGFSIAGAVLQPCLGRYLYLAPPLSGAPGCRRDWFRFLATIPPAANTEKFRLLASA